MSQRNQLAVFLLIIAVYICSVFLLPPDPATLQKYHFSEAQAYLLSLTVAAPMVAIWLSAFYGYVTFRKYAKAIDDSPDGKPLYKLSKGLMLLAFSLPTLAAVGSIFNYLARDTPDYLPVAVLIRHLLVIGFPLVAFILIGSAAEELLGQLKRKKNFLQNHKSLALIVITASSIFAGFTVALAGQNAAPKNIYSFPIWFVIISTVIPYLYMWYRGLTAVYSINFYRKHVKGLVYKKSFVYLSAGLGVVIALAVTLQFLTVLSPQLQRLHFTPLLLIVYALIALYALGYGLIALGAKKLKKIEEV